MQSNVLFCSEQRIVIAVMAAELLLETISIFEVEGIDGAPRTENHYWGEPDVRTDLASGRIIAVHEVPSSI